LLSPSDPSTEVERLLRLPLSPGAVALLAPYSTRPEVQARFAEALRDPRPETRAVAARAIYAIGAPLRQEVERALSAESYPEAAREEIRALALLDASPETDAKLKDAAARFGRRLDFEVLHAVARSRGDRALSFYYGWPRESSLDDHSRKLFLRVASHGSRETLVAIATRALQDAEASSWTAVLELLQADSDGVPTSLLRSALESPSDEIRGTAAWAMLSHWSLPPPTSAREVLPALAPRPESRNVETEFGVELLARLLGRAPSENAAWIAHVRTKGTERWMNFLKGSQLFELLTEGEKDAIRKKHWPDTPKGWKGSPRTVASPPRSSTALPIRLTSSLPSGSLADLLAVAGCRPGSPIDLGEAEITYGEFGRPRGVVLRRLPPDESCARAAKAVFLLGLLPAGDLARPDRPELVLAFASRQCSGTLEEGPVAELTAGVPAGGPSRVGGDVRAPKLLDRVEPNYPESLRKAGLQGTVIIEAIIEKNGCVFDPLVLKSAGTELDRQAIFAVSQWRYEPATFLDGRPVRVYLTVTVTFNLRGRGAR
jgi:TonB family protein